MVNYNIRGNSYMEIASNIFIVKIAEKMFVKKCNRLYFMCFCGEFILSSSQRYVRYAVRPE